MQSIQKNNSSLLQSYQRLAANEIGFFIIEDGQIKEDIGPHLCAGEDEEYQFFYLYPGSFNPIHEGHRAIYGSNLDFRDKVYYEISINIRHKGTLEFDELVRRLDQFTDPVVVTNAVYFAEKIKAIKYMQGMFSGFLVGFDTAERILNDHELEEIEAYHANFIVYPRSDKSIYDLPVCPSNFKASPWIPSHLRYMSSTAIRTGELNGKY